MPQPLLPPPLIRAKDAFSHHSPLPNHTPCALTLVLLACVCPLDGKRERKDEAHLVRGCCPTPLPSRSMPVRLSLPTPAASFIVMFVDGWQDAQSGGISSADRDAGGGGYGARVMRQNQRSAHHTPSAASALLSRQVPSAKLLRACSPCTHLRRPSHPFHSA